MLLVRRLPADGAAIVLGQGIAALAVDADGGLVIGQPDTVAGDGVAAAPRRATSPLNSSTPIRRWTWKLSFKTGAGIGLLPECMVARELESGRLVSWGKLADKKAEIWILFPSRRFQSAKVTAFVETLLAYHASRISGSDPSGMAIRFF